MPHVLEPSTPRDSPPTTPTPPRRILVVEDDPQVRHVVARLLRRARYEVVEAGEGAEALKILTRTRVDLVVADVFLPGLAPREFLDWMTHLHPDLPYLLMSGSGDRELRRQEVDPSEVTLRKPFEVQDLLRSVEAALLSPR
jgi:two-component system cell cycle sensor histidine kinase/response regulator CckA